PPRVCDGREWDCAGSDFAQGFVEGLLGADDRAEADSGGGHEVPAGRQGRIRQPDEQGGHEWGGPAEERVGDVEADREPGVADPCREHLGEEARQGAVVERQHAPRPIWTRTTMVKLPASRSMKAGTVRTKKLMEAMVSIRLRPNRSEARPVSRMKPI